MKITEIQNQLTQRHQSFCNLIGGLSEQEFLFSSPGKWTAGQQLDHICRATSLLPLGLSFPSFLRRMLFGRPRNTSRAYDNLIKKYLSVLDNGGRASGIFIPKPVAYSKRDRLIQKLHSTIQKVTLALAQYSEAELDETLLPHPLLGKLTLREMMMFTIYHVEHHHNLTKKYLQDYKEKKALSV